jgi:hypothetical protein
MKGGLPRLLCFYCEYSKIHTLLFINRNKNATTATEHMGMPVPARKHALIFGSHEDDVTMADGTGMMALFVFFVSNLVVLKGLMIRSLWDFLNCQKISPCEFR